MRLLMMIICKRDEWTLREINLFNEVKTRTKLNVYKLKTF